MPLRNAAVTLGLATEEQAATLGKQQLFDAISNRFALEARTGGGINLLPGQMSDRDVALMKSTVSQLAKTPEGNKLILTIQRINAENAIALAEEADRYMQEKGSMVGWLQHRREWAKEHRVTFEDIMTRANVGGVAGAFQQAIEAAKRAAGGGRE